MDINSVKPVIDQQPAVQPSNPQPSEKGFVAQNPDKSIVQSQKDNIEKNEEILSDAVDKLNKTAVIFDRSIRFQIHEKTSRTMVSVVDTTSDKVIRQIPHEEILELVSKMDDYLGLIFDKKA